MKNPNTLLMKNCQDRDLLYNPTSRRCYKSCEQKNKVTHPVTEKCRKKCNNDKIRRIEDFRCVKPGTSKKKKTIHKTQKIKKTPVKKAKTPVKKAKTPVKKAKTPVKVESKTDQVKTSEKAWGERLQSLSDQEQMTKDQEQLIPLPLQKELAKNFTFLDKFLQKGMDVDSIDYIASDRVSEIITIYLYKKYKQTCPMYPIKTYNSFDTVASKKFFKKYSKTYSQEELKKTLLKSNKTNYLEWDKDKFLSNLKLCLETGEQLIIVPVRVPLHFNMLFIKASTREIIRFEPHGKNLYIVGDDNPDKEINKFLKNLTDDINTYFKLSGDKKFTYKPPMDICPRYTSKMPDMFYPGFQAMECVQKQRNKKKEGGFCVLWSWFFAECVMANPEMDVKDVYKEAWEMIKTNEKGFATIIRGYFLSINEELVKMNKTFRIERKYIKKNEKNNDIFLEYLNEEREHLRKKTRIPFRGGAKGKPKFILPTANPKVKPIN